MEPHSINLNGLPDIPCSFSVDQSIVKVPPPTNPKRPDGKFYSKAELRSILLGQMLAITLLKQPAPTAPAATG